MDLEELETIRLLFRNAHYEMLPSLWFQYGDQLMDALHGFLLEEENMKRSGWTIAFPGETTMSETSNSEAWRKAYAELRNDLERVLQRSITPSGFKVEE